MPKTLSPSRRNQRPEPARRPKRWTLQQCEQLEQAGFLPGRYELINGEIYDRMTAKPPHSITLSLLAVWLEKTFGRLFVRTQDPIRLSENKPEPDAAVTREPVTAYMAEHPSPEDLLLVAEVSDTTLSFDLSQKALLYARAGIVEYWVVDIAGRRLVAHRQPSADGYQEITEYAENETLSPLSRPEASVPISELLPPV